MAQGQSDAFQGQSEMYGMKAGEYEKAMGEYFDGFLDSFAPMLAENEGAMMDFQRRYGPLMDNVTEGIKTVSATNLAAQGREQLSLDMETLTGNMNASMASRNLGRSGISVESERRLASDAAQQARSIDVNSQQQAMQLQGQGIQTLNSMQNMEQGLKDQRLGIMGSQGQAHQQIGQSYGNMSQNMYGASQNMFGRGFGAINNANNNLANLYGQAGQNRINQQNSFYSGVAAPNSAGLINSYNNQSNSHQADAGGYMQFAGTAASKVDWGKLTGAGAANANAGLAGNTTGGYGSASGNPVDLF